VPCDCHQHSFKISFLQQNQSKAKEKTMNPVPKVFALGALLLLPLSPQTASAYYDPGVQRWLNRDPVAELGFAAIRGRHQKEAHRGANQYRFNLNDPCGFIDPEGLTVWVCSRPAQIPIIGPITTHVYFYDDDPEHLPHQSCSEQNKSGGPGTLNDKDVPPDQNPNCTPVEGTGELGQDNDRAHAIMSCCEQTINNGPYIPFADDCHNRLNRCLSAGANYYPIKHPRIGHPRVKPIFSPMPLTPRTVTP
jgi:RHS repeat-associated protein